MLDSAVCEMRQVCKDNRERRKEAGTAIWFKAQCFLSLETVEIHIFWGKTY